MPKLTFKTKEEIPEGLRDHAKEGEGGFVVGVVHESFRDRNIDLAKERDTYKSKFESSATLIGEDPAAFATELTELRSVAQQVKDGKLTKKDDIDREVNNRVEAQMKTVGTKITDLTQRSEAEKKRADTYEGKFKGMLVDQAIISAVTSQDSGANPTALPDILNRARSVFLANEDGTLTAMKDGAKWYADGDRTVTPKEWLALLLKEAPYLGNTSNGTGGAGGKNTGKTGMSDSQFNALPPAQRIALARKHGAI